MFSSYSLGFSISGIVFMLVILIISASKKKYNNYENYIYRFIIFDELILLILESICPFLIKNISNRPFLNEIVCRLYFLAVIFLFVLIIGYSRSLFIKDKAESSQRIISQKYRLILLVSGTVIFLISCFFKLSYSPQLGSILNGIPIYIVYSLYTFSVVLVTCLLFKNKTIKYRWPILFAFVLFYLVTLSFKLFIKVPYVSLAYSLGLYVIGTYLTLESQDSKMLEELNVSKVKAIEADKNKTNFLSNMSHEIRTPMNAIMGFSECLVTDEEFNNKQFEEDIESIHDSAVELLETIDNILDISRIESEKETIDEFDYSVKDLVYEVMSFVDSKIDKKKTAFNVNVDFNIPSKLRGDRIKISKIIINILDNSIKNTSSGEISLDIACKEEQDKSLLHIIIRDTGIGISKEEFGEFFDGELDLNENLIEFKESSIGLIVVKKLVDLLGGTINFESDFGVGTIFYIDIPQQVINKEILGEIDLISHIKNNYIDCSGKTIIIVDDNEINLKLAKRFFEKYKFNILTAENGKKCIDILKNNENIDMIFLDHMMPELDGIETIKLIKKVEKYSKIPVIAMTANVISENKAFYEEAGFSDFIQKPIAQSKLSALINKYFG